MTRLLNRALMLGWLLAIVVTPSVVSAQTGTPEVQPADIRRPYRGLFGGPSTAGTRHALDFTANLYGAYDDDVYAEQRGVAVSTGLRRSGWFGGLGSGLTYAYRGRKIGFGAEGGIGLATYPDDPLYAIYRTSANLNAPLARHTDLALSGTFVYAPEYRLGLFVDATNSRIFEDPFATATPDLGLFRENSYRSEANVAVTQTLRDQSSLSGFYSLLTANYASDDLDYVNQGAGVRYQRPITRSAGFHAGYSYGGARYPNVINVSHRGVHNIDLGVDYGRALSLSRRTHFSFSTGSALFFVNEGVTTDAEHRLNFALLGSANLNHEMGRTWTASVSYLRSVSFHEGFVDAFVSQSMTAGITGLLSRRLQFSGSTSYTRGVVGAGTNNDFDSAGANAGLQYALTRLLAAYVNYIFYQYSFPPDLALDPRFPPSLSRNGVRFGLTTSIHVIRAK